MAVSKVRKLQILAHGEYRDEILAELRKLAAVHISDVKELLPESENPLPSFLEASIAQAEAKLATIRHCLDFGNSFLPKPPLSEALLKGRPVFSQREVEEIVGGFDLDQYSDGCVSAEKTLHENESQIAKKEVLLEDISHWLRLDVPLEEIHDTRNTHISLGICDSRTYTAMIDELEAASPFYQSEVIEHSRTSVSLVLAYAKELEDTFTPILRKYGWRPVHFLGLTGTPAEIVERLREQRDELHERNQRVRERIVENFLPVRDKLLLLSDHYLQEVKTLKVQQNFFFTSSAFAMKGWVLASEEANLKRRLNALTKDIDVRTSEPGSGDLVPVLLRNPPAIRPFSMITEMYGHPQYTEFDPTPFLAPFFAFFFGICIGDAGYGVLLMAVSLFILRKLHIRGAARFLVQILAWGGLASFIVGILTGGIFAIPLVKFPYLLKKLVVLDTTTQVLLFLYVTFLIGLGQILFGLGLKMIMAFRDRDYIGGISDQGLWMVMLVCLAPLVYKYLFGGMVSEQVIALARTGALVLVIPLVLGRGRKSPFLVIPLMGLLNALRDLLGFFGDTLSYARLMALALSGAFLAMTVNDIASLVLAIPYGIGVVMAIFILLFGHAFNVIIQTLGAFVHSLRLQYLEFFSKFFTGGGVPFEPFAEIRESTIVRQDVG